MSRRVNIKAQPATKEVSVFSRSGLSVADPGLADVMWLRRATHILRPFIRRGNLLLSVPVGSSTLSCEIPKGVAFAVSLIIESCSA